MGSANVSSSIFAMLFVGWLVGLAMGAGLALYMRTRQSRTRGAVTDPISPAAAVRPSVVVFTGVSEASMHMYVIVHKCMHFLWTNVHDKRVFLSLCRPAAVPSLACMGLI